MSRRKARVVAFKVIFQYDQVKTEPQQALSYLYREDELTAEKDQSFAAELTHGAIRHLADIDEAIKRFSREWDLSRMSAVDRNIMRLAGYEILFMQPSEPVVAIDEAVGSRIYERCKDMSIYIERKDGRNYRTAEKKEEICRN